jgi:biopolymer transport protein ExbB
MLKIKLWILVALLPLSQGMGQNLDELQTGFQEDLNAVLTELAELQASISEQKIPLSKRLTELESELVSKRFELTKSEREADNRLVELGSLKSQTKALSDEQAYLKGLISEYAELFETRIHITEVDALQPLIEDTRSRLQNPDTTQEALANQSAALLEGSIDRLNKLIGGSIFEDQALSPNGLLQEGKVVLAGPFALFASANSEDSGLAQLQLGAAEPTVTALGPDKAVRIGELANAGEGLFPVDPTMGNALKIAATEDSLVDHMKKGGPVMVPIVGLGLAAVMIALLKWLQLSRIRLAGPADLKLILAHLKAGHPDKASTHIATFKGQVGDVLRSALEHRSESKEYLEELMYEKMLSAKPALERFIALIALTAATAPLLGLLGTVTGMINTFNMITVFGTGDPRMLSGGISEALITTKFGLVVAVPALICHAFVTRKVKGVLGSMEQVSIGFINGLPDARKSD